MRPIIVRISDDLRDSLDEALDRYNTTGKIRPYYLGVSINKQTAVLLPIRAKIPKNYSLLLASSQPSKRNGGIDFTKMILINKEDLPLHTERHFLDSTASADILAKRPQIIPICKKTIEDYKTMLEKDEKGLDLSKDERLLKERSTLKNYIEILEKINFKNDD